MQAVTLSLPALQKFSVRRLPLGFKPVAFDFEDCFRWTFRPLRELDLPVSLLDCDTFSEISALRELDSFKVHGLRGGEEEWKEVPESAGFPALTKVNVTASYTDACLYIERLFHRSHMKSVVLQSTPKDSPTLYSSLIGRVAERWSSIENLSIKCGAERPHEMCEPSFTVLKPLLACGGLVSLILQLGWPLKLDDEEYLQLLSALPLLRRLDLHDGAGPEQPPSIRMTTICSIPVRCPCLEYLGTYMDFREDCHPPGDATVARWGRLMKLNVHHSPISGAMRVSMFVMELLHPRCELIAPSKDWAGVHAMMGAYRCVGGWN
ncbi:hypothetical protein ONZ45_g13768 [Pleurotus djamor]|nr:hypothetical protein ONZ45_g13768 [Pleurotus djamor]